VQAQRLAVARAKGAATQALQNLNLAFGYPETAGIPLEFAP